MWLWRYYTVVHYRQTLPLRRDRVIHLCQRLTDVCGDTSVTNPHRNDVIAGRGRGPRERTSAAPVSRDVPDAPTLDPPLELILPRTSRGRCTKPDPRASPRRT